MTYKELLFKMAEKGMLTLSTKKDDRGLFWAGMDNMDALDKPFDWGDFEMKVKKDYTAEEIESMKEHLAESEWEGLKDRDLKQILWEGCVGWDNMEDEQVVELYEVHFEFED